MLSLLLAFRILQLKVAAAGFLALGLQCPISSIGSPQDELRIQNSFIPVENITKSHIIYNV